MQEVRVRVMMVGEDGGSSNDTGFSGIFIFSLFLMTHVPSSAEYGKLGKIEEDIVLD
jgi:hypothetical protein